MPDFPTNIEIARVVALNPSQFHTQPGLLALTWQTLVEGRGGTFHADRIQPPAHHVAPNGIEPLDGAHSADRMVRIRGKVRDIANRKGIFTPPQGAPL